MATAPTAELTVAPLFNGPQQSANGGYLAGLLAARLPVPAEAITVTLRKPPPLAAPMLVTGFDDGRLQLHSGDDLIADAAAAHLDRLGTPSRVSFDDARDAERRFAGHRRHPFPTCFVCGPGRGDREGMGLFPGAVDGEPGLFACGWVPTALLAVPGSTAVRPEFVWAALDCPGAWTVDLSTRDIVLGRITATVDATPSVGEQCAVTSHLLAEDGRKFTTCTAVYGASGQLLGEAESVWIELRN